MYNDHVVQRDNSVIVFFSCECSLGSLIDFEKYILIINNNYCNEDVQLSKLRVGIAMHS